MLAIISSWLNVFHIPLEYNTVLSAFIAFLTVFLGVWLIHLGLKRVCLPLLIKVIHRTEFKWDDALISSGLLGRLFQFIPLILLYTIIPVVFVTFSWVQIALTGLELLMILLGAMLVNSVLTTVLVFCKSMHFYKSVALRSYVQVLRLILFFVIGIVMISIVIGKSPLVLLSGIGALSAVLLLVFKDSILGFVASLQLTFNKLVETGDWIEVPEYGADGNVLDVSLNTVQVQNWDKTITTIPTYSLVSGSFKNWRGMEESGGRRIKRAICIDMSSVKFVNQTVLDRVNQLAILRPWLDQKLAEIQQFNDAQGIEEEPELNGRCLTNLGVFRVYLEKYLQQHPDIHDKMTFLVRHLEPTSKGVPVEFYVFSKNQNWNDFEAIQADIMDHVLAILPQFGLRVFQEPSGYDLKFLAVSNK